MSLKQGLDKQTCKNKCASQASSRGCSFTSGNIYFSLCSSCSDLTGHANCSFGVANGTVCNAGCDIASDQQESNNMIYGIQPFCEEENIADCQPSGGECSWQESVGVVCQRGPSDIFADVRLLNQHGGVAAGGTHVRGRLEVL